MADLIAWIVIPLLIISALGLAVWRSRSSLSFLLTLPLHPGRMRRFLRFLWQGRQASDRAGEADPRRQLFQEIGQSAREAARTVLGLFTFGMTLALFLNGSHPALGLLFLGATAVLWRWYRFFGG